MRAIIIGAGRGSRLQDLTDEVPKTLVEVMGRPMLDWILDALDEAGFSRRDVVFVCGYRQEVVRARYPDLTFVENRGWESNNILLSLMMAREHMGEGFVSTYADIVYSGAIAKAVRESQHPIALGCDTDWRRRYARRTEHPETDAEKLVADGAKVTAISRRVPSEAASGEFIGVMKVAKAAVPGLLAAFDELAARHAGKVFREGRVFEKAYLLDFLAELVERGESLHRVDTHGAYMEIDTLQDRAFAADWWAGRS
jgi:L-glutamine-phosphate cytidylyltransferase